jgi:hypothetical protein
LKLIRRNKMDDAEDHTVKNLVICRNTFHPVSSVIKFRSVREILDM